MNYEKSKNEINKIKKICYFILLFTVIIISFLN